MKDANKMRQYEPTIADVLEAVQTGFSRVETTLGRHEEILDHHDRLPGLLAENQSHMQASIKDLGQRVSGTQNRVEDIAEMLEDMTDVVDENRDTTFDHEQRIGVLEKASV